MRCEPKRKRFKINGKVLAWELSLSMLVGTSHALASGRAAAVIRGFASGVDRLIGAV